MSLQVQTVFILELYYFVYELRNEVDFPLKVIFENTIKEKPYFLIGD